MKKLLSYVLVLLLCLTAVCACKQKEDENLTAAKNYLSGLYKDKAETTPSDYDVVGVVMVGTTKYDVEWSVDVTEGIKIVDNDTMVTIDVDEKSPSEVKYKLTATVKNEKGQTSSVTFNRILPAFKESGFSDYAGAEDGANVVVKGIISGIIAKSKGNSSNCLYIQSMNGDGGYYVYGLATDPVTDDKLEVGMTVQVSGTKTTYNGTLEIEDATVEVLDETNELKPVDITEIFKNAKALDDAALAGPQAMLVTIKGVEVTGQDTDSGYYKFKLGDLETYVRVSSSVCPLTKDEQAAFIEGHSAHTGWIADVTGVICVYNGAFYLTPVSSDAFVYISEAVKTDADKVAAEKDNLSLKSSVSNNTTLDLTTVGASYEDVKIEWTSDNVAAVVSDGKLVITLAKEATTVKVTATLTCGDAKDTKEFTIELAAAPDGNYVSTPVDTPAAGTAYKFYLTQANLGQTLYFAGSMSGNYLATTDRADLATDVYLESVDGGYRLYFNDGSAKKYIDLYEYTAGKVGVQITDAPSAVYTWNADAKTLVANVAGGDYYLGTYKTYNTFSASNLSYITGDNASSIGKSNFPGGFCTVAVESGSSNVQQPSEQPTQAPTEKPTEAPTQAPVVEAPEYTLPFVQPTTNTAYNLALYQAKAGKTLYFAGAKDGNFLATTETEAQAANIYLESANGGYYLYFNSNGAKKYIDIYSYTNDEGKEKAAITISDTPSAVFTYNATLKTMVANVAGEDRYIGTYNDYTTMSSSSTYYITGENAANIEVTQFPAGFLKSNHSDPVTEPEPDVDVPAAVDPVAGTAYKFMMYQATKKQVLYLTGEMDGYYLATTTDKSAAVDVYVEAFGDGYAIYFTKNGVKTYIDVVPRDSDATKVNAVFASAPTAVYKYDATLKTMLTNVAGSEWYIGTYDSFVTFGPSKTSYITGDNASKVGVTQYVFNFVSVN